MPLEDDHLYDVVRPRGGVVSATHEEDGTYQNLVTDDRAVYQNMDDL